ncbi:unnamed protein product [Protopolystoma xenopodis]|uniref:Uncharacterized protein n=1 Tax=Protopolystoma xenopodis TaxID=117903 RepID=A0A448WM87_9PLAT|nr:unnamed protein product [Protopolystoma xenopodis]
MQFLVPADTNISDETAISAATTNTSTNADSSNFIEPPLKNTSKIRVSEPTAFVASNAANGQFNFPQPPPAKDFASLARHVLPIAGYLGPYSSRHVLLLCKLCRLGAAYFSLQV